MTLRSYSLEEVSKHSTAGDCWLIISSKVYDVTSWVPHHPGGNMILLEAGKDTTQLFESYHPLYVRKLLQRYCIGLVDKVSNNKFPSIEYPEQGNEVFYITLKQRVEELFRKHKINPRFHPYMLPKSLLILAAYMIFYYLTFFGSRSFSTSVWFSIFMGFFTAEIGISINHDSNHGSYSPIRWLENLMSASLDFVGASSFMWRHQHVVGHHSYTNVDNYDPDIRVKDPDVRRVTAKQPIRKYHAFQHVYLGLLYGLLALKSIILDDFNAFLQGSIGPVKIPKMTVSEASVFFGGKIFYAIYMILVPLLYSHHSMSSCIILYVVSQLIAGWVLAFLFQVAHVVSEVEFLAVDTSEGVPKLNKGWAEAQVRSTANFSTNSMIWTHISGGLNYQIEHHLFPSFCHLHYPMIHSIVRETCREFNVPYFSYPSFWAALLAHFQHLKRVGTENFVLRVSG